MEFPSRKVFARQVGNISHNVDQKNHHREHGVHGDLKVFSVLSVFYVVKALICLQMVNIGGGIILHMLPDLQINDHLRLRKPHPCGSYEWIVIRLGADIGLECKGCGHRVMLTRRELAKRLKVNLTPHEENKTDTQDL